MGNGNFLHLNRDENSLTARLFEGILFPKFIEKKEFFGEFLNILSSSSDRNLECIKKKFTFTNVTRWRKDKELSFNDGMLFLECVDVFSYIKNEFSCDKERVPLDKILDKTEFDCVILCEDDEQKKYLIVLEVKAYSNLDSHEIDRQHEWLEQFKKLGLFEDYYHFALIAYDNLKYAKEIFDCKNFNYKDNGLSILTWEDFRQYVTDSPRFNCSDFRLFKTINVYGDRGSKRYLLKNTDNLDNSDDYCKGFINMGNKQD